MRVLILVILVLLVFIRHHAHASLECFTDEPRQYKFEIDKQSKGLLWSEVTHETGPLKGVVYTFVIKDVASPNESEDYLTKRYAIGNAYKITYALRCKHLE